MPRCMYAGSLNVACASSLRVRVQVVDDRLVDVPADEVDGRQRRHRAAGVRTDERVHVRDAVLLGELGDLVEHLEADAVAGEGRRVAVRDELAAEPVREQPRREFAATAGSVPACGISSQPTITLGGLKKWMPRKCLRKPSLRPCAHRCDR